MQKQILAAAIAAILAAPAMAADPAVTKLEKQIAELQKQVAEIKQQTPAADTGAKFRVYGFARLDGVHNFGGRNNRGNGGDWAAYQPNIALTGSEDAGRKGETYLHARTSRIGFEVTNATDLGALTAKVEGDFYSDIGSSNGFRLRHAYGQIGGFLAGQTWSTFMDLDSSPDVVDFNGPTGNTSLRQPQIRYTHATDLGNFIAALETKSTGSDDGDDISRGLDIVLRWDKTFGWGHLALRGLTTENAVKSDAISASKRGYGVGLGGSYKITGSTALLASTSYGKGMGRFFNESVGAVVDGGQVYLPKELGVVLALQQQFNDKLRGTLAYGQQRTLGGEYIDHVGGDTNRFIRSGSVGLWWSPVKDVEFGSEFMLSHRQTIDGSSGTEPRLHLVASYAFGN